MVKSVVLTALFFSTRKGMNENMGRDFIIAGVCFLLSLIWMGLSTMFPGGIGCALDFVLEKFKIEPNEVTTVLGIVLTTAIEVVFILIMLLHIINILKTVGPVMELIGNMIIGFIGAAEVFVVFCTSSGKLL